METGEDIRVRASNRRLYDRFWKRMPVTPPQWFSTWRLTSPKASGKQFVEIGSGTRPRSPFEGTVFLDLSLSALKKLREKGGFAGLADAGRLPVASGCADVVVAFDVVEHVEQDARLFDEVGRVLRDGGSFIFSVPLHPALFDRFDRIAGHFRRYEPAGLVRQLAGAGFAVAGWCPFGSRPSSGLINWAGAWWLERYPSWCAWIRDVLFRLMGRYFQRALRPGRGDLARVGLEVPGAVVKARKISGLPR